MLKIIKSRRFLRGIGVLEDWDLGHRALMKWLQPAISDGRGVGASAARKGASSSLGYFC